MTYNTQKDITRMCNRVMDLLLSKNEKYGDAALNPARIMSKANSVEQILIRIDDKLNRINQGAGLLASDEDVVQDLAGYFILLMIALERENLRAFEDCKVLMERRERMTVEDALSDVWELKGESPQVNWVDGPEPELDEEPGPEWISGQFVGLRKGPIDVIQSGVGRSQLEKENEKTSGYHPQSHILHPDSQTPWQTGTTPP